MRSVLVIVSRWALKLLHTTLSVHRRPTSLLFLTSSPDLHAQGQCQLCNNMGPLIAREERLCLQHLRESTST